MHKKFLATLILFFSFFISSEIFAQQSAMGEESVMRSEGKIYVVLAVCLTILAGLILYLVRIDRKIKKIEDKS